MQKRRGRPYITFAAVAIFFLVIAPVIGIPAAIAVFLVGLLNIFEHYLDRCRYCGGWRVRSEESWFPSNEVPGRNEATESRTCKTCGIQEINHYLLRDINHIHPS
jgi:hypothetical protein